MMTPEGATDFVLALVCFIAAGLRRRQSPGLALALCTLGLAAALGVARFGGAAWAVGPHQFMVLVASTAAVPLLAWCLRWPESLPSLQPRAAWLAVLFGGAGGVIIVGIAGFKPWAAVCLLFSMVLLLSAAWQRRHPVFALGTALLIAGGVVQGTRLTLPGLPSVALLHLLLASGIALLARTDGRALQARPTAAT